MKLIKLLDMRKGVKARKSRRWALFLCPYCNKQVEKEKCGGLRDKSCGCHRRVLQKKNNIKHGEKINGKSSSLYGRYNHILDRCLNPNNKNYSEYGGRGITVCDNWKNDFSAFKKWALLNGYHPSLEIDRKNNDKGYSPDNCRWTSHKENSRNRRGVKLKISEVRNIKTALFSQKTPPKTLASEFGVSISTIRAIKSGRIWGDVPVGDAL